MNVPLWVKLAAASKKEILDEVEKVIDQLGGDDAAQEVLRQLDTTKTSNWALDEKFILVAKTQEEVLEDFINSRTPRGDVRETPKIPAEEKKTDSPGFVEMDPAKMTAGIYLATLLALLLGVKALTPIQYKNINLRQTIVDLKDKVERPAKTTTPESVAAFISDVRSAAYQVDLQGIPVEVLIPLFGHESGWGSGDVYQKTNNPGSISATDRDQESVPDRNGQRVRVYNDLAEGISSVVSLLHNPRYKKALAAAKASAGGSAEDRYAFYDELQAAGYCNESDYAEKLKNADRYFYKIFAK
jgi:hypothetical protein